MLHHGGTILVADDDADIRKLVVWALRVDGFNVIEAHDGYETVYQLGMFDGRHRRLDLLVTDVNMPGPSGLCILQYIRSRGLATPTIIVTALEAASARARRLGADVVLSKPFDIEDLRTVATSLVRESSAVRTKRSPP